MSLNGNCSKELTSRAVFGEIFWVSRLGWDGSPFGIDPRKQFRPGIVVKCSDYPTPVMMAPRTTKIQGKKNKQGVFVPEEIIGNGLNKEGCFMLKFRRPVKRGFIKDFCGKISEKDIENMKAAIKIMWRKK